ncbi:GspE/PulE family protein [Candidatus Margulisiibacteriota bacterium]
MGTANIYRLLHEILSEALETNASDIHFESFQHDGHIRMRIDGLLHQTHTFDHDTFSQLCSRIKVLSNINISQPLIPHTSQLSYSINDTQYIFRVSVIPSLFNHKIVLRVLKNISAIPDVSFLPHDHMILNTVLQKRNGLIIICGPTGSGKSTTLYHFLRTLETPHLNITTIEDPVEYIYPTVTQIPVHADHGLSFDESLRNVLRQDPDVILVGEIRDSETAHLSLRAALTGHLVLTTVHAQSVPTVVSRLLDLGCNELILRQTLLLIFNQRLVRTLCPTCLALGCADCHQTGYRGRQMVYEYFHVADDAMRSAQNFFQLTSSSLKTSIQKMISEGVCDERQLFEI